ncbi:hypothetical protein BBJ28_00007243, partial [Nothophytophthora sp. Chile5]
DSGAVRRALPPARRAALAEGRVSIVQRAPPRGRAPPRPSRKRDARGVLRLPLAGLDAAGGAPAAPNPLAADRPGVRAASLTNLRGALRRPLRQAAGDPASCGACTTARPRAALVQRAARDGAVVPGAAKDASLLLAERQAADGPAGAQGGCLLRRAATDRAAARDRRA